MQLWPHVAKRPTDELKTKKIKCGLTGKAYLLEGKQMEKSAFDV